MTKPEGSLATIPLTEAVSKVLFGDQKCSQHDILLAIALITEQSPHFSAARKFSAIAEWLEFAEADEILKKLPYKRFLSGGVWRSIREYLFEIRGRACQVCCSSERLQIHHSTYKHRGSEYKHLNDLVILCRDCHAKFHGKLPQEPA